MPDDFKKFTNIKKLKPSATPSQEKPSQVIVVFILRNVNHCSWKLHVVQVHTNEFIDHALLKNFKHQKNKTAEVSVILFSKICQHSSWVPRIGNSLQAANPAVPNMSNLGYLWMLPVWILMKSLAIFSLIFSFPFRYVSLQQRNTEKICNNVNFINIFILTLNRDLT